MNRNNLQIMFTSFVILLAMIACVLPSQTVQPTPGIDPNAIETSIVGTLEASARQTEQASFLTPTAPLVPTETLTLTPKISDSGTSLVIREDQSTLFTDYKAGFQLTIPAGWMAVRLDGEEYLQAFDSDIVLQTPEIWERLTVIRDANVDVFRLDAIDVRPGHMPNGILSTINVVFESGNTQGLETWEQAERDRHHPYADFKFISSSYPQLANGTQVLVIEQRFSAAANKGTIYYRGVFFLLPSGTIVLDFHTNLDFKDSMLLEFDQVVNSLTPLNP
jgi:hypothetical protein